jgi:sialic acid synthase SpsE
VSTESELLQSLSKIVSRYDSDSLMIIGTGISAGQIDPEMSRTTLAIGLGYAELAAHIDIALTDGTQRLDNIGAEAYRSEIYLAPNKFDASPGQLLVFPRSQLSPDGLPPDLTGFLFSDFRLTEPLFVSALQLALQVAKLRGRIQTVYVVGLDFEPHHVHDRHAGSGQQPSPLHVGPPPLGGSFQEQCFLKSLYALRNSEIHVRHVGFRTYSSLTPAELNTLLDRSFTSADSLAGRVSVVAELTTNHFGDRRRLEAMIRASHAAGADYVKLQKRDVRSFYRKDQLSAPYVSPFGKTFGDYREQLELSAQDFWFADRICKALGIGWFASVLDKPSFDFMRQFNPVMLKIPSTISEHTAYLKHLSNNYEGTLVVSTGMTNATYVNRILDMFSNCNRIYLLQCNSAYPTPLEFCNIAVINHYRDLSLENPRVVPGYSSHDLGSLASVMAVAAGARMVEKHVKLGSAQWAHFDDVALDLKTSAFSRYVGRIREAERMLGVPIKRPNSSEYHKYA